jgi:hypothetical protein
MRELRTASTSLESGPAKGEDWSGAGASMVVVQQPNGAGVDRVFLDRIASVTRPDGTQRVARGNRADGAHALKFI